MRHKFSKIGFLSSALGIILSGSFQVQAQLTTQYETPANLINNVLVGNGLNVSNITSQGAAIQFGTFNGANSNLGMNSGAVIATCDIAPSLGLANGGFPAGAGTPGDPALSQLAGGFTTNNAGIIQFDFIPGGDTIQFDYVFASMEYNFYVNSNFNDVFGFFLSGPNPAGGQYVNQNIALIPNTNLPVTINNVNNGQSSGCAAGPCNNCQYFVDNCNPTSVVFGGFTTVLTAKAPVVPCTTYTLRLGVADVFDGALNSAVFLRANSFSSGLVQVSSDIDFNQTGSSPTNDTILYEGCSDAALKFVRTSESTNSDTVFFQVSGSATMGSDYNNLPNFIIFPPGIDTVTLNITPFSDGIADPGETVTVTITDTVCNQPVVSQVTLLIQDVSDLQVAATDTNICIGQVVPLAFDTVGGSGFFNIDWSLNGNVLSPPYVVQTPVNRDYVVSIYDECLDTTLTDTLSIKVFPRPNVSIEDYEVCSDESLLLTPSQLLNDFNYTWNPDSLLDDFQIPTPSFNYGHDGPGNQTITIRLGVDSAGVTCRRDSATITVFPRPNPNLNGDTLVICENGDLTLNAGGGFVAYQWENGPASQTWTVTEPGWYRVEVTDDNNCTVWDSAFAVAKNIPVFDVADQEICVGDTAILVAPDSLGNVLWGTGSTANILPISSDTSLTLSITNECGPGFDTVTVSLIDGIPPFDMPNVFTPNGDGINDTYFIAQLANAENFTLSIYNRWGTLMFSTSTLLNGWDGTAPTGGVVPQGTYFVVVDYLDCLGQEGQKSGSIMVLY